MDTLHPCRKLQVNYQDLGFLRKRNVVSVGRDGRITTLDADALARRPLM